MELSKRFKNKTLFLDTAPIIYFIEKNPRYNELLKIIISLIDSKSAKGVTSTVTLLEVLVKPLRDGDKKLAEKYKAILLSANGLLSIEITHEI
ncbi:MAG: PIN domain-containing protein, partial [Actinomycetota bacterium]|nr:PIN domain-containing protein [Actinomycetota bacterium]